MENPEIWLAPLLLLPGVSLMILSTSTRFSRLHDELHYFEDKNQISHAEESHHLLERAKLFKNSLANLYFCVCFLALAGLLGAINSIFILNIIIVPIIFLICAILFLLISSILLIRESKLSLNIIFEHFK